MTFFKISSLVFGYLIWVNYEFGANCSFKGTVHPKIQIDWQFTHPQAIQDLNEFVSSLKRFGEF